VGDKASKGEVIAYIDPSRAGTSYSRYPVIAPVSGTITSMPLDSPGATVSTSSAFADIGSLASLKLTVYVAEKYSAFLKVGLPALVQIAAAPGENMNAEVSEVAPVVDSANRTIKTTLAILSQDPRIKAGMMAQVSLVIQQATKALVVPNAAVRTYNDDNVVYIIEDSGTDEGLVAKRVVVKTGLSNDSSVQLTSGVKAGDRVITAGTVTDGSPVRVAGQ
jgi:RND family efflux transporter MFP subunit